MTMLQRLLTRYREHRHHQRVRAVTIDAARERVRRGAVYLDGVDGGWHTRLNPVTLELADAAHCVLGQLHGEFRHGLLRARILDLSSAPLASLSPVDLGFQARRDLDDEVEALDYAFLTRAWREEIARREGIERRRDTPPVPTVRPTPATGVMA